MAQPNRQMPDGWEVVNEPAEEAPARGAGLLFLALKALSQRTLVAIDNLFCLMTVASGFWLWYSIPDPSPTQITSLGLYAAFVLAANWLVRRK